MKRKLKEQRFDGTGGLNTKVSEDLLNTNEFVELTNVRVGEKKGALTPRGGTRRMHTTAFGAQVDGVFQWIPEGMARQLVAMASGDIYYKATYAGAFTGVGGSVGGGPAFFAAMREETSGAPLRLYIADGDTLWRFDGTTLTDVGNANGLPDNIDMVVAQNARLFMHSTDYPNSLFWTDLGDPEAADGGEKDGGGSSIINVLGGESITSLLAFAGAVLIPTEDTLAIFEGYSDDDIQIAQDTDGISDTKGARGPLCLAREDKLAFMISEDGFHFVNKQTAPLISELIEPDLLALDRSYLGGACIGINKKRVEAWFAVPGPDDGGLNKTVYAYSLTLQRITGKFTFPFGITCFATYEDGNGDPTLIAGCSDGFVRDMDTGFLDDVLADGSGGSAIEQAAEYAPFTFPEAGPEVTKTIHRFSVQADVADGEVITIKHAFDDAALTSETLTGEAAGRVLPYRVDATANQGERLRVRLESTSATAWRVTGMTVYAFDMSREQ